MKKALLLALGLVAAGGAMADDFTGCYVGVSAGFAESSNQWTTTFFQDDAYDQDAGSADADDTSVGVQFGCDLFETEDWVVGAKIMAADNQLNASHVYIGGTGPDNVISYQTDEFLALVGRVGFKAWDHGLIYGNFGYAKTSNFYRDNDPSAPILDFSRSTDREGFIAGVGYEHKASDYISIFVEYNLADFDDKEILLIDNAEFMVDDYRARIDQDYAQFSVGLNWRF